MKSLQLVATLAFLFALAMPAGANMAPPMDEFRAGLTLETARAGARVLTVAAGQAAEAAGVKPGDIILAIDGRYARSLSKADLKTFAEELHIFPVALVLVRDGKDVLQMRLLAR